MTVLTPPSQGVPAAGPSAPAVHCPGRAVWPPLPGGDPHLCVRAWGHRGDHRDAAGWPWNDERWLD